jgi:ribonuclease E
MSKKMLIDATHAEETRVVVVEGNKVDEFDFESLNKRQLSGNIYLAKVTRVEPSLQAAFIDYGGNRHGFLAFAEIHPDYYQIPVADREALLAEEEAYAKAMEEDAEKEKPKRSRSRRRKPKTVAADAVEDAIVVSEVIESDAADNGLVDVPEGEQSAVDVAETPAEVVEETTAVEAPSEETTTPEAAQAEESDADGDDEEDNEEAVDDGIESVADEDVEEEVRPRKPRPRRYKIQEVVKVRQILLVQVVKEERGNKGAALTTYLSLAGRYCVLMPNTARGGGISRKITNAQDRKNIKEITGELEVPQGAGLIVRTAGAKRNRDDIIRDYEYLMRQWSQIRDLTLESIAPAQIYAEGDIIKRSIRDLYNSDIDEIIVEGDRGFEAAQAYMTMLMPTHLDRVKKYTERMPLFARHQVETYLAGMFNPTVQLKSGGYIVIDTTEALVAVDVNSGKATKESSIEKTALRTNLEAAEEVARQLRLRDLAGLIVIDFIDMEERRNNSAVEKRMKDKLKSDRARIQVGRISGFGLMEMSRQRLRPGMLEATTAPCAHCLGTGLVRSDDSQALSILREIEEEAVRKRTKEVCVTVPVGIANYLLNHKRDSIALIESQYGLSIIVEASPVMIGSEFNLDKRKTSSRIVADVIDMPTAREMEAVANIEIPVAAETSASVAPASDTPTTDASDEDKPKKRRRRRRRRGRKDDETQNVANAENNGETPASTDDQAPSTDKVDNSASTEQQPEAVVEKPKRTLKRKSKAKTEETATPTPVVVEVAEVSPEANPSEATDEKPKRRKRRTKAEIEADKAKTAEVTADATEEKPKRTRKKAAPKVEATEDSAVETAPEEAPKKKPAPRKRAAKKSVAAEAAPVVAKPVVEAVVETPAPIAEPVAAKPEEPAKPKKRGWWSRA